MTDKIISSTRQNFQRATLPDLKSLSSITNSLVACSNGKIPTYLTKRPQSGPSESEELRQELKHKTKSEYASIYNFLTTKDSILTSEYHGDIISEIIYRVAADFPDMRILQNIPMTTELLKNFTSSDNFLFRVEEYAKFVGNRTKTLDDCKRTFPVDDWYLGFSNFFMVKEKIGVKHNKDTSKTLSNKGLTGFIRNFKAFLGFVRAGWEGGRGKNSTGKFYGLLDVGVSLFFVGDPRSGQLVIVGTVMFNEGSHVQGLMGLVEKVRLDQEPGGKFFGRCGFDAEGIAELYTNYVKCLYNPNVIHGMMSSMGLLKSFLNKSNSTPMSFQIDRLDENIFFELKQDWAFFGKV